MKSSYFTRNIKVASLILVLGFCHLSVSQVEAAVPKLLTYQGVLKDDSGNFLTGTYDMTFKIYSAATGGTALWTETQSSVSTSSGKFDVQLGSVTALNLDFNADYWLSIKVGSDAEMSPRIRLTSMPYGIRSEYENNGFTQTAHDALSHKSIAGVEDNSAMVAKTNFKLDAYSMAAANSMGDMVVDVFNDATGIDSGASSNYTWRGSPDYDVALPSGGIDSNAKLVLHDNGTDASTTFTDSSSSSKTVTANGNAQIDTAQSKFGGASALLDGSGDYLTSADSADWRLGGGSGNFTIDFWVRVNSIGLSGLITQDNTSGASGWAIALRADGTLDFRLDGTVILGNTSTALSTGTWYHIAVVRGWSGNANDWAITIDGVARATATNSSTITDYSHQLHVGGLGDGSIRYYYNGWLDEIRISDTARWTANFTAPSAEYSTTGSGSATVISDAYSEPTAPTEAMIIADEELGSGTITYSVSRDNGTTWTQVTKETITDISAQPSGTQMKWKAVITDDAELKAIAIAI